MIAQFTRILVPAAVSMVVGLSLQSANAAPIDNAPTGTAARSHDVFSEGLRQGTFNPYTEGAHGAADGALIAGMDRSGVSAPPARQFDPYSDGARTVDGDPRARGAALTGVPALV